jgi:hypothetical protein
MLSIARPQQYNELWWWWRFCSCTLLAEQLCVKLLLTMLLLLLPADSCCACACYNPKDYQAGAPDSDAGGRLDSKMGKRLSSIEGGDETVAVININATAGGEKGAKTYEVSATPIGCDA